MTVREIETTIKEKMFFKVHYPWQKRDIIVCNPLLIEEGCKMRCSFLIGLFGMPAANQTFWFPTAMTIEDINQDDYYLLSEVLMKCGLIFNKKTKQLLYMKTLAPCNASITFSDIDAYNLYK